MVGQVAGLGYCAGDNAYAVYAQQVFWAVVALHCSKPSTSDGDFYWRFGEKVQRERVMIMPVSSKILLCIAIKKAPLGKPFDK